MAGLSTRPFRTGNGRLISRIILTCLLLSTIGASPVVQNQRSLCLANEETLFACPIASKQVAVCHDGRLAIYRFGRRDAVELEIKSGRFARAGYSGGGESQIQFEKRGYSYVIFDRTVRTEFGTDGQNAADTSAGVLIRRDGQKVGTRFCGGSGEQTIAGKSAKLLPKGTFFAH